MPLKLVTSMLAILTITLGQLSLATAAPWSGPHIMGPSRSLLAPTGKPTGIRLSQVSLAATPLSELLKDKGLDASMSTDPGFSKANPAQLVAPKRPLKIAFYDKLDSTRKPSEHKYIMEQLMPAAETILARSMRIRTPSGILPFVGFKNPDGSPIAPAPADASGKVPDGIDADIFIEVTSMPAKSEECEGVIAGSIPAIFEDVTYRPIFGIMRLCHVNPDTWEADVATIVHELMHALGFGSFAFPIYPGYLHGQDDFTVRDPDGGLVITSPNVKHVVQQHFGCSSLRGAEFEDDGASGTVNSHWEERIFQGELLDSGDSGNVNHHNRHVLSDLTLALLQDTNWYDVKYGSAGWNSYGYQGGCAFASGSKGQAMKDPKARRYLCSESQDWAFMCTHDFTGDGVCISDPLLEGFKQVLQFDAGAVDCMGGEHTPGTRCLQGVNEFFPECVKMTCSDTGKVLVGGKPCDAKKMHCPPDDLMCGDPGLLTCVDTHNDCGGKGDCYMGSCYCHTGWGGDDCSVPICYDSCPDGSACPASGFCGVDECGTWSSGSDDRGAACNTPAGASAGDLDADATTDAGDGEPGTVVTSVAGAGKGVITTGKRRMPPKGMMRSTTGQHRFTPHDVPADIPDVMMMDGTRLLQGEEVLQEEEEERREAGAPDYADDYAGDYAGDYDEDAPEDGDAVAPDDAPQASGDVVGDSAGEEDDAAGEEDGDGEEEDVADDGEFSSDVTDDEVPAPSQVEVPAPSAVVPEEPCGSYGDEC